MAEGYTQSCTPPLILDGYVYTAQGRYVYKLDKETGEKKAESPQLEGLLGYALNPILYAEGMLFVQIDKMAEFRPWTLRPWNPFGSVRLWEGRRSRLLPINRIMEKDTSIPEPGREK